MASANKSFFLFRAVETLSLSGLCLPNTSLITYGPSSYAYLIELNSYPRCRLNEGLFPNFSQSGQKSPSGRDLFSDQSEWRTMNNVIGLADASLIQTSHQGKQKRVRKNGRNQRDEVNISLAATIKISKYRTNLGDLLRPKQAKYRL